MKSWIKLAVCTSLLTSSISYQEELVLPNPAAAGLAPRIVAAAHKFHGILFSTCDETGDRYFYRDGKRCQLFTWKFLKVKKGKEVKQMKLTFKLVRPALKGGGDRYEAAVEGEEKPMVIYVPQVISRKVGSGPKDTLTIDIK